MSFKQLVTVPLATSVNLVDLKRDESVDNSCDGVRNTRALIIGHECRAEFQILSLL